MREVDVAGDRPERGRGSRPPTPKRGSPQRERPQPPRTPAADPPPGVEGVETEALRTFLRRDGFTFLNDGNILSVGIGCKNGDPARVCVQFTVRVKVAESELGPLGTVAIPRTIEIDGAEIPTDVVEQPDSD